MIIQNPDGSYEICCPLAPAAARWLRTLVRAAQLAPRASLSADSAAGESCCGPCLEDEGAVCRSS